MSSAVALVKESAAYVAQKGSHVRICDEGIEKTARSLSEEQLQSIASPKSFDTDLHYVDGTPLTAQYLLVVDALNFCFWPEPGLEYEHLSRGVKAVVQHDANAISAQALAAATVHVVRQFFGRSEAVPLEEERARLLREVGAELLRSFRGQAAELIRSALGSATQLVGMVAAHFPGFRDHAVYRGRQVFLYKRAQIFVGDVWGAFQGQGLGAFEDIAELTMFADYRVPVVLRQLGMISYSEALAAKVSAKELLSPGSEEEVEIRACTIEAVQRLQDAIRATVSRSGINVPIPNSIQLDWWLWETGEKARDIHADHHRTLTTYY